VDVLLPYIPAGIGEESRQKEISGVEAAENLTKRKHKLTFWERSVYKGSAAARVTGSRQFHAYPHRDGRSGGTTGWLESCKGFLQPPD
jgi:hypothetical protein